MVSQFGRPDTRRPRSRWLQGCTLSEGVEKGVLQAFLPASGIFLVWGGRTPISTWNSLRVCLCPNFSISKDTGHPRLGPLYSSMASSK